MPEKFSRPDHLADISRMLGELEQLDYKQRRLLILHCKGESHASIATLLDLDSTGTVPSMLRDAKSALPDGVRAAVTAARAGEGVAVEQVTAGFLGSDKTADIQAALADVELDDRQRILLVMYFMGERRATIAEAMGLRSEGSISGMLSKAKKLLPPALLEELSGGLARFRKLEQPDNPLQSSELDALDIDELTCLVLYCIRGHDIDYIAEKTGLSQQIAMATLTRVMHALSPDLRQMFVNMRRQHECPSEVKNAA